MSDAIEPYIDHDTNCMLNLSDYPPTRRYPVVGNMSILLHDIAWRIVIKLRKSGDVITLCDVSREYLRIALMCALGDDPTNIHFVSPTTKTATIHVVAQVSVVDAGEYHFYYDRRNGGRLTAKGRVW